MSEPSIVSQNTLSRKPLQIYVNPSLLGISLQEAQESPNPRNKHQRQGGVHRSRMDVRMLGFETPVMSALQHLLDHVHGNEAAAAVGDKAGGSAATATPARAYVRDARAMAATPADVKELPGAYAFVVDMPGLGAGDVRVQVEDDRVLAISGERRRLDEEAAAGAKYLRMERRMGKLMRRFALPEDADAGKVSAACRDGVLTVTVEKLPPPEPKKPRTIQVSIA